MHPQHHDALDSKERGSSLDIVAIGTSDDNITLLIQKGTQEIILAL